MEHLISKTHCANLNINPKYIPEYKGPIEGWVVKYLKKHYWRVQYSMEYEDMMNEAYLVFMEVSVRYTDIDNPKWFMAMFQKIFMNKFCDLSNIDTNLRSCKAISDITSMNAENSSFGSFLEETIEGDTDIESEVDLLFEKAPNEVKQVVRLIVGMPSEMLSKVCACWSERGKKKQMGNQMLCSMLGMDSNKVNIVKMVDNYFK